MLALVKYLAFDLAILDGMRRIPLSVHSGRQ